MSDVANFPPSNGTNGLSSGGITGTILIIIHSGLFSHSAKESPQAQGIERGRRQLSSDIKKVTSSTLEQSQESRGRQRRQTEEAETQPQSPPSELSPEQERGRRQTSDPDQLCPALASFVMPRAAVNSQGENIVNSQ